MSAHAQQTLDLIKMHSLMFAKQREAYYLRTVVSTTVYEYSEYFYHGSVVYFA